MTPGQDPHGSVPSVLVRTTSPEQTEALGRALGAHLRAGDVIALRGELGVGKTVLTRGIVAGAGSSDPVASPTFTLIREYRAPHAPVIHVDLYRLDTVDQLLGVGLDDVLATEAIIVIEWAEQARALLPEEYLWVEIRFAEDEGTREVQFVPRGRRPAELLRALPRHPAA